MDAGAAMLAGTPGRAKRMGYDGIAGLGHHLERDWALKLAETRLGAEIGGEMAGRAAR